MGVYPTTGLVVWVPTAAQAGPQAVLLRVRDNRGGVALQSFTVTVSAADHPPVITSAPQGPATAGHPWQYSILAQDPDPGDTAALTYALVSGPSGMTLPAGTSIVTWTPSAGQAGQAYTVTVRVSDPQGAVASQTFSLSVVADTAPANQPVTILNTQRSTVELGQTYTDQVLVSDPDGDPLTFSVTGPTGLTIDQNGVLRWTPTAAQVGTANVTVTVSDGRGSTATQAFTITVTPMPTLDHPPTITSTPPLSATVGTLYAYNVQATDPDNDAVAYTLTHAPLFTQPISVSYTHVTLHAN
jgi:hypothetical protein